MEKKLLKAIFILAGIAILVVITFFLTKPSTSRSPTLPQSVLSNEEVTFEEKTKNLGFPEESKSLGEELYEKSLTNTVESLPQVNPFEDIKTNPFK